jgi:hypothetical protein
LGFFRSSIFPFVFGSFEGKSKGFWLVSLRVFAVQPDLEPCIGKRALSSMLFWVDWDEEEDKRRKREEKGQGFISLTWIFFCFFFDSSTERFA